LWAEKKSAAPSSDRARGRARRRRTPAPGRTSRGIPPAIDLPPRAAAAFCENAAELLLDRGPAPFGIVFPRMMCTALPYGQNGECVKDAWMTFGGAPQLPHALRFGGSEAERALLARISNGAGSFGTRVMATKSTMSPFRIRRQGLPPSRCAAWCWRNEASGPSVARLVELVAGPEIAAEVQVRDGEQVVRPLRERSHSLPHLPRRIWIRPLPGEGLEQAPCRRVRSLFRRRDSLVPAGPHALDAAVDHDIVLERQESSPPTYPRAAPRRATST